MAENRDYVCAKPIRELEKEFRDKLRRLKIKPAQLHKYLSVRRVPGYENLVAYNKSISFVLRNSRGLARRLRGIASELERGVLPYLAHPDPMPLEKYSDYGLLDRIKMPREIVERPRSNSPLFHLSRNPREATKIAKTLRGVPASLRILAGYLQARPNDSEEQKLLSGLHSAIKARVKARGGRPRRTEGRDFIIERLSRFLARKSGASPSMVADLLNWAHDLELNDDDVKKARQRMRKRFGVAAESWR